MGLEELNTAEKGFFDENGRCIPCQINAPVHQETRRYFICEQPVIDYAEIYTRLDSYLDLNSIISAEEFEHRAQAILKNLADNHKSKNIIKGVGVPFILPKAAYTDLGQAFEKIYLNAIERAYQDEFPNYDFTNHFQGNLAENMQITPNSRHEQLLKAMEGNAVVGYYFPCLSEYSIPAVIEQVNQLPPEFLLAGGFDTAAAIIGSPSLLQRAEGYPPMLWLSGLSNKNNHIEYHFEAYGYNLTFNRRPHLEQVAEYWSSALVVLG